MLRLIRFFAFHLRTHPLLGRWALRLIPDWRWTLALPGGLGPFHIRLRQNRSLWLRNPLESESVPFAMLRRLVRPGDVVYDVGANLGVYSRYLAGLGAARVVAFEPVEENRILLAENLALGRVGDQVAVQPFALADRDGTAEFQLDDWQSTSGTLSRVTGGAASLARQNLKLRPLTRSVACRRLDTLIAEGLPAPDVLKLDVEGAEALVLRGAERLLRERSPCLVIELHGAEIAREVLAILFAAGYTCVGKVAEHIAPSGFAPLDEAILPRVQGLYDVHFVAASRDAADLAAWQMQSTGSAGQA